MENIMLMPTSRPASACPAMSPSRTLDATWRRVLVDGTRVPAAARVVPAAFAYATGLVPAGIATTAGVSAPTAAVQADHDVKQASPPRGSTG
ncbi:MAG: hypothetical protein ACTHMS_18335 [Jatrophihabitans sp.]|uniref:hypothetical protein n=1 Tax=Jatrophihabitans sp. TaxID=1932789 RepID=UPI003F7D0CB6